LRVLVCGGREYNDYQKVELVLGAAHKAQLFGTVIHGAARGADSLAGRWAKENNIPVEEFPADWNRYGRRAGYIRNAQMLKEGKPELVIAFPGGPGTKMMVELARSAGVVTVVVQGE